MALGDFPGPFGRGRAVDEVHRRRTAGETEPAGRERDGDGGSFAISENSRDLSVI